MIKTIIDSCLQIEKKYIYGRLIILRS